LKNIYHINGNYFGRQYKESLSDFNNWDQKEHAEDWILFPENMGENLSLDETSLSNGELYTILTNKSGKGKKGTLIAMIESTQSEKIIKVITKLPLKERNNVKEVTIDMANSMHKVVKSCFSNA
jgi:transposase